MRLRQCKVRTGHKSYRIQLFLHDNALETTRKIPEKRRWLSDILNNHNILALIEQFPPKKKFIYQEGRISGADCHEEDFQSANLIPRTTSWNEFPAANHILRVDRTAFWSVEFLSRQLRRHKKSPYGLRGWKQALNETYHEIWGVLTQHRRIMEHKEAGVSIYQLNIVV